MYNPLSILRRVMSRFRRRRRNNRALTYREVVRWLAKLEYRVIKAPPKDNMRVVSMHLRVFPDGSAIVEADWRNCPPTDEQDEKLVRMLRNVFAEPDDYAAYDTMDALIEAVRCPGPAERNPDAK